jgi:virginiamycin B lyase
MRKVSLGIVLAILCSGLLRASEAVALTGIVSSDLEGPMEGVLVSAKRVGGTITVTVVSNKEGRYSFPASRLGLGKYQLTIRAIQYDPVDRNLIATVENGKNEANIKLKKTDDLASQLSDIEWLMSVPGTDKNKDYLFETCSHCHTLGPILKSQYDTTGWMTTFARMRGWDQISSINRPVPQPDSAPGATFGNEEFASYLSSINLSSRSMHDFELKTLPRPHGDDTKVIITEYDLPRPNAEPHDAVVDPVGGMIWYGDFAEGILGRLNPTTGEVKEWEDPSTKAGYSGAFQDLEFDPKGDPWMGRHELNGVAKFDKKTETFTNYRVPDEHKTSTNFLSPSRDGKIWIRDNAGLVNYRLDPQTGEMTKFEAFPAYMLSKDFQGPRLNIYGVNTDSNGNLYEADIAGSNIIRVDGETGTITVFPVPTAHSGPRRMHMDLEDHLWIGEYYGKKIAMLDTKTGQIREWPIPLPWYGAYDAAPDKEGNVWTGTMTSEIILRLNPKTGEFRSYQLPRLGINVRRVDVDNSGAHPVFWIGENHRAKIAKVEPIE